MELRRFAELFCSRTAEIIRGLAYLPLLVQSAEKIYRALYTREITGNQYRVQWDNFDCYDLVPILQNYLSVEEACCVRVHCCFAFPVKLIYYINGQGAYLNTANDLTVECGYVFDIPMNPGDSLNFAVDFDQNQSLTARCKFFRIQEVR